MLRITVDVDVVYLIGSYRSTTQFIRNAYRLCSTKRPSCTSKKNANHILINTVAHSPNRKHIQIRLDHHSEAITHTLAPNLFAKAAAPCDKRHYECARRTCENSQSAAERQHHNASQVKTTTNNERSLHATAQQMRANSTTEPTKKNSQNLCLHA